MELMDISEGAEPPTGQRILIFVQDWNEWVFSKKLPATMGPNSKPSYVWLMDDQKFYPAARLEIRFWMEGPAKPQ
jgi:hypothetical protein